MLNKATLILRKTMKTLFHREEGVTAVEYAIVLPLFMSLAIGGFEIGRIYMVNASLEGAITEATRTAMTGNVPDSYSDRSDYIKDIVLSNLDDVGVASGITISMKTYESFANIGEPEPFVDENGNMQYDTGECFSDINNNEGWDDDMGSSGSGGEENIVVMKVDIILPYMTGFMTAMMGGKSATSVSASTAIRNEPFGGSAWEAGTNVICT